MLYRGAMMHPIRFASSALLLAAFALQACGGAVASPDSKPSPAPISVPPSGYPSPRALRGDEAITIESGHPGNDAPSCSDAGSVLLGTRIVLKLDTGDAVRTLTTGTCAPGQTVVVGDVQRSTSSSSLTATQAEIAPILTALRGLTPLRNQPCGFDGDANQLTIAYDNGTSDVFADTEGPGQCEPATGEIAYPAMTNLFALANGLF